MQIFLETVTWIKKSLNIFASYKNVESFISYFIWKYYYLMQPKITVCVTLYIFLVKISGNIIINSTMFLNDSQFRFVCAVSNSNIYTVLYSQNDVFQQLKTNKQRRVSQRLFNTVWIIISFVFSNVERQTFWIMTPVAASLRCAIFWTILNSSFFRDEEDAKAMSSVLCDAWECMDSFLSSRFELPSVSFPSLWCDFTFHWLCVLRKPTPHRSSGFADFTLFNLAPL